MNISAESEGRDEEIRRDRDSPVPLSEQNPYVLNHFRDGFADLRGAYLSGADGGKITITKAPIQISNLRWQATIWDNHMQIGCEFHSHAEWESFDDARIQQMDNHALAFWSEWREILLSICKRHAA